MQCIETSNTFKSMSLLLILKNNSNKNLIDHLWKKIGNKLITLKITTKKKKEEKEGRGQRRTDIF